VSSASPTYTSPGALPPGAEWLAFLDASTGWATGSSPASPPFVWLYVTHDGGSSWHKVDISFPAQALALWRPTFFTKQDGLFPVQTFGPAPQYTPGTMLYTTQDGGQSWTSTAVPFDVTNAVFIDMNHAVSVNATDSMSLYTTSGGCKHWTKVQIQTTF